MLKEIQKRLTEFLKATPGMNKVLLAHLAGVHRNTLEGIEQPDWNPAVKTLDRIMRTVDALEKLAKS